jgi:3alpha(or 20beta)-hydroxysteroid dehydrogenase
MGSLDGKVAIVSGAARGQGEAQARLVAAEGAQVLIGDVLDAAGEGVAASIGGAAAYRHVDVTEESDWQETLADVEARWGQSRRAGQQRRDRSVRPRVHA